MTGVCLSSEGWGPISPTNPAHLTTCFQHGFLTPTLNMLFLVTAAVRMRRLNSMPPLPTVLVTVWIFSAKMVLSIAALLISTAEFIAMAMQFPYVNIYTCSLALQTVAVAVAVCLHYKEQFHNRIASTPLLLFWLFSILLSLLRLRTAVSVDYSNDFDILVPPIALFVVTALALFVFECQPKPHELFDISADDVDDVDNSGFGKLEDSDDDYCTSGSPEERANVFSRYTYTWVESLLQKGYREQLHLGDIWKLTGQYRPDVVHARFQHNWQKELRSGNPSLFRATARTYWPIWVLAAIHEMLRTISLFARFLITSRLIEFAANYGTDQGSPIEYGYFYAVALFIMSCELNNALRLRRTHAQRLKTFIRTSYMTAVYQKTLTLSNDARQKYDIGSIVTHMSIDSENIATFFESSQGIWCGPLVIIFCLFGLYQLLGWSTLVGIIIMLACMPIVSRIARIISTCSKLLMGYRGQRMKIMNEVITGIQVIKMYAWELPFIQKISNVRIKLELSIIRKNNVLKALLQSTTTLVPFLVSLATFGAYSLFDNKTHGPLDARLVFIGMPLLNIIRLSLTKVPQIIPNISTAMASLRRLSDFLTASEIDFCAIDRQPYNRDSLDSNADDVLVSITNATFKWSLADTFELRDINMQCKRTEVVAVIGRVGSGKSSLLSAILGDIIKCSGNITVRGNIAYVAQQLWILNATLRDNILFGSAIDRDFYDQVIEACALRHDIDALSAGDMTEIGERGITLSGGQKMRVSLARAIYARADVYILDDPLAAVDSHISKHIFTHVLGPHGILRGRARVLVTNAVQYLDNVDNIYMLRNGRIIEQGSKTQAMARQGDIFEFIYQHVNNQSSTESSSIKSDTKRSGNNMDTNGYQTTPEKRSLGHTSTGKTRGALTGRGRHKTQDASINQASGTSRIMTTEHRHKGRVKWKTYDAYIKASGACNVSIVIIAFLIAVAGEVCINLWLRHWTSSNTRKAHNNIKDSTKSVLYYLLIYGALGIVNVLVNLLQQIYIWVKCATRSSTVVHQNMLTGVLRSPMSFFNTTPTGRILNRFSADIQKCDEALPINISNCLSQLVSLMLGIVIVGISTPPMLIIFPILAVIGYHYQKLYISSSREIRRLDSTTCSPIYAHFQESADGISTIRAYGQQSRFIAMNEDHIGQHIRVDNAYLLLNQWLAMRLETVGNIVTLGTALIAVASIHYSGIGDPNTFGLAISSTLILCGAANGCIRYYSEVQVCMTHLERATEYAELLPEAANVIEDHRPKETWPQQGIVEFKNYSTRYREGLELVLKDLSFSVQPRQKFGIVGRTGAGKSSLSLALFRIIEAASGQILLDGKDISKYGLFDVRSKLSIIPQDPILFAGTVRENLDPFNNYSDQDIWRVLEQAHLADYIRNKEERLEFMVEQSGSNFSVGQRQLICLARALLKHAKVLVLDEATAAIDNATDTIIQQTIRSEFKNCTVLTIAHRLDTIIDSDMVLVIDNGQLAEYDTPDNLLANKDSLFTKLVKETQNINT
ncbi:P-loop containing nucleoside triphosphate hydrolase protein [Coemansia reversa NRRL 1564]|uniref:P-loop containing nucleoside triphosphate hydrolase protein n=1 Tax=Coemansia reversa (strain ATCC 12441 / NRRL 1564) TaxID=763665 RepID=A0A2G5B9M3_COERN|nr:P-loop containing nucleoside triphosphate hydrolase protein [Coemansia reversa NRRL 1564]|eukprot:PIA15690.1 P-loop containing nucleoside triphosphate hydrolase protein [Coemansia reversa NRRL 1564]